MRLIVNRVFVHRPRLGIRSLGIELLAFAALLIFPGAAWKISNGEWLLPMICLVALLVLHFSYRRRLQSLSTAFHEAMQKHDYLDDQCDIIVESACVTTQFWQMIAACTDFEASCTSLIKSSETHEEKRRRLEQLSRDAEKLRSDFDAIYSEAQRVAQALDALEEPLGTSDQLKENAQRLREQVATQLKSAADLKEFLTQAVDRKFKDTLAKFAPPDA
jgi:DNA repair ATPase RecN